MNIPAVTGKQMAEVDRVMLEELHITLVQMMENAGRSLAQLAISRFGPRHVVVLAGTGGNGGGAMTAARHLRNRGVGVQVVTTASPRGDSVTARQLDILERMGVELIQEPTDADLIIDGLIGYGLRDAPTGRTAQLITWANQQLAPVLALDLPSGLNATTGQWSDPHITAAATLTLALPKTGLVRARAKVGELYLADIGVPASAYQRFGLTVENMFTDAVVIRI